MRRDCEKPIPLFSTPYFFLPKNRRPWYLGLVSRDRGDRERPRKEKDFFARESAQQAGAEITTFDLENLISSEMVRAGEERLSDIGEASVTYLAKEGFLAMVGMACRQKTTLGAALRHEIQRQKKNRENP